MVNVFYIVNANEFAWHKIGRYRAAWGFYTRPDIDYPLDTEDPCQTKCIEAWKTVNHRFFINGMPSGQVLEEYFQHLLEIPCQGNMKMPKICR